MALKISIVLLVVLGIAAYIIFMGKNGKSKKGNSQRGGNSQGRKPEQPQTPR